MNRSKKTAEWIGYIGGVAGLLALPGFFGLSMSLLLVQETSSLILNLIVLACMILPPIIVIIAGRLTLTTYDSAARVMKWCGMAYIIGYGISPAAILGLFYIYAGYLGVGEPSTDPKDYTL